MRWLQIDMYETIRHYNGNYRWKCTTTMWKVSWTVGTEESQGCLISWGPRKYYNEKGICLGQAMGFTRPRILHVIVCVIIQIQHCTASGSRTAWLSVRCDLEEEFLKLATVHQSSDCDGRHPRANADAAEDDKIATYIMKSSKINRS